MFVESFLICFWWSTKI